MTGPTMVSTADELHVGRTSAPAWQAAVERLAGSSAAGSPEDLLVEWRASGIIDGDLSVAPDWQLAIDTQYRAAAVVTLVARMADVAFLTNLYLCPTLDRAVTVTMRTVLDRRDGADHIDLVHPQAEVAAAEVRHAWPLLRRVLPPLDEFRADPGQTSAATPLEPTPESLAAADGATASVLAHGVDATGRRSDELVWYLCDERLHRLAPRRRELYHVPVGSVANDLSALAARLMSTPGQN